MQNTIRMAFVVALLAAATFGASPTLPAGDPPVGSGACIGMPRPPGFPPHHGDAPVATSIKTTKARLGSLRRDDTVVIDVEGEVGGSGVDTNAVRDIVSEYVSGLQGMDTNGVEALVGEYYGTNIAPRIDAAAARGETNAASIARMRHEFVPLTAAESGFTEWEVTPEQPLAEAVVPGLVDRYVDFWSLFPADSADRSAAAALTTEYRHGDESATELTWAAAETKFGVAVTARRLRVPRMVDIWSMEDTGDKRWASVSASISNLSDYATGLYNLVDYGHGRAKALEAWQYTNAVSRADMSRGVTDWAVVPTWPTGRVVVDMLTSGFDEGKWALFPQDAAEHSSATALVEPVFATPDAYGNVTSLTWENVTMQVPAVWTNELNEVGASWELVSGGTNVVVTFTATATRVMLPTYEQMRQVTAGVDAAVSAAVAPVRETAGQAAAAAALADAKAGKAISDAALLQRSVDGLSAAVAETAGKADRAETLATAASNTAASAVALVDGKASTADATLSEAVEWVPAVALPADTEIQSVAYNVFEHEWVLRIKEQWDIYEIKLRRPDIEDNPYTGAETQLSFELAGSGLPVTINKAVTYRLGSRLNNDKLLARAEDVEALRDELANYKPLQEPVTNASDRTTSAYSFVTAVTQDVNGVIYVTRHRIPTTGIWNPGVGARGSATDPLTQRGVNDFRKAVVCDYWYPTTNYQVGAFVLLDDTSKCYVCTNAHVAAASWTAAEAGNWREAAVADVLADLATALGAKASKADVDPLLFAQYYPDGSVKSAAEFTSDIMYDDPDTTNRTITVKPFCDTGTAANDNSSLVGRVVIPPFVDAQGNPYISDDGTRYKVVGVTGGITDRSQSALTAIVAPNTTTDIGSAFDGCTSLASVSLPAATSIGNAAFNSCTSLASVSLPTATNIGNYAFSGCSSLASVSLPAATDIGTDAFSGCSSLASASLPAVTNIGNYAFRSCRSLASVSLPAATSISESAFSGCSSLASASLPAVTSIGSLFRSCSSLASVSLPAATNIGNNAFYGCRSLASVSLPAATNIGNNAFFNCRSLASVSLPAATGISNSAFDGCTSLASVDFGTTLSSVPTLGSNAFRSVPDTCKIVVPDSLYDAWIAAQGWSTLYAAGYQFLKYSEWEYARKYELDGKANDSAVVKLTGDQTIAGNKTFYGDVAIVDQKDLSVWGGRVAVRSSDGSTVVLLEYDRLEYSTDGAMTWTSVMLDRIATRASNPTPGHFAALDAVGNLTDSGIASSGVANKTDIPTLAGETMPSTPTHNELAEAVKKIFTALGGTITE